VVVGFENRGFCSSFQVGSQLMSFQIDVEICARLTTGEYCPPMRLCRVSVNDKDAYRCINSIKLVVKGLLHRHYGAAMKAVTFEYLCSGDRKEAISQARERGADKIITARDETDAFHFILTFAETK